MAGLTEQAITDEIHGHDREQQTTPKSRQHLQLCLAENLRNSKYPPVPCALELSKAVKH